MTKVLISSVILAALLGLAAGCATHLAQAQKNQLEDSLALAVSIKKDLPDSGPVHIKGDTLVCDIVAVERAGGMTLQGDAGACPAQR
jgi:hypothetical protein